MSDIFTVLLPDIGEGVVEGEVIEWLKSEGDAVEQDEAVVTVMTDKATVDLPAPYPGTVSKHYHQPGDIAIKDKPIYDITVAEGVKISGQAKTESEAPAEEAAVEALVAVASGGQDAVAAPGGKVLATPATRGLARELQVDLRDIDGTGPAGRVTANDIRSSFGAQAVYGAAVSKSGKRAAPIIGASTPILDLPGDERSPLIGQRNYISEKMTEAKLIIPHFAFFDQADCTRLIKQRNKLKAAAAQRQIKLTYMPFFIRALSICIKEFPYLNSSIDLHEKQLVVHSQQNFGIAVKNETGLVVPVLKGVETMNLEQLSVAYDALMKKAADDALEAHDMRDATISLSNFGAMGGQWATPIVNYPEVCILGVARIQPQVVARNREPVVRDMLNLSWCCDHRVIDGQTIAEASNRFISLLENPAQLL